MESSKIPGKGGGSGSSRFLKWDLDLNMPNWINHWATDNRHHANISCTRKDLIKSANIFLCLFIMVVHSPGFINCGVGAGCEFPARWAGRWFQKGLPDPVRLAGGVISSKGTCRDVDGDKFLIENTLDKCFRCVVLHEKHINVLQYKESPCSNTPTHQTLDTLCSEINGDALLYSMFRLNTAPVPCPFRGSFSFTYSGGHGVCADPPSAVDSCTDDSRLLLRFQACADVHGSESRTEELVCLATWKEGSTRYLVGKLEHRVAKADEDKFRCFVYEQTEDGTGYDIAQSGDATCDGLFSAVEGSRTMRLTKATHPHARCHLAEWFAGRRHWRGLAGRLAFDLSHRNGSFRVSNATTGDVVKRVVCAHDANPPAATPPTPTSFAQYVVHVTAGCNSGYACLRIHKRAPHVVELQTTNNLSPFASDVCQDVNFDLNPSEIVTLTTQSYGSVECPLAGIYSLEGVHTSRLVSLDGAEDLEPACTPSSTLLSSACSASDKMELKHDCAVPRKTKSFQCRGSWEENGVNYVIATAVGTRKHLCLAYVVGERSIQISGSTEECLRNIHIGREGPIALNATNRGYCPTSDNSSVSCYTCYATLVSLLLATAVVFYSSR